LSFIDRDLANKAGLRRVDDREGAEIVGRKIEAGANYSGMVFPYFEPDKYDRPREYRLRRDQPDIEQTNAGVLKERNKYLSPQGRSNFLFFTPGTSKQQLSDVELPIVIVEGEKKALAGHRLANFDSNSARFLSIGVSGVWNWRGTVGKASAPNGKRVSVKGPIADLDLITWTGRRVYILFDSNVHSNDAVAKARIALAKELEKRGADVFLADLPENCGVNGIDDYLGAIALKDGLEKAIEAGNEIIARAVPFKKDKPSQASKLVSFAEGFDLFHSKDGQCYCSVSVDGHLETYRTDSRALSDLLTRDYFNREGKIPASQSLKDALNVINGKALFEGDEREVHIRYASHDGCIYVDLSNEAWQIVKINSHGHEVIEAEQCPVRFTRTKAMLPLPTPLEKGRVDDLRPFLNLKGDSGAAFSLIKAWLVNCMRPDFPFPILILTGEPGTAKSTTTRIFRDLIDPRIMPHRSCPRDERDLMIGAKGSWLSAFDNISNVSDWLSDAFCRISTGGGYATRTLYQNEEETFLPALRPIILNGIGNFANRSDLIDRSIPIELEPISADKRVAEREFFANLEKKRPAIFTGLIQAVSEALKNIDNVKLEKLPRLADFAQWATAAELALGMKSGDFMRAYAESRDSVHSVVIEGSAVGEVIREYCFERGGFDECLLLKDLLEKLRNAAGERSSQKSFPKSSKGLRNELQRINPNLRELGIEIAFLGKSGPSASRGASVRIKYRGAETSLTSPTSLPAETFIDDGDDAGYVADPNKVNNVIEVLHRDAANGADFSGQHTEEQAPCDLGDVSDVGFRSSEGDISDGTSCPECRDGEIRDFANDVSGCEICGYRRNLREMSDAQAESV